MSEQELETRSFELRLDNIEERSFTALAVPYDQTIDAGGYQERFAPGAIDSVDNVMIFYGHDHLNGGLPIGKATGLRETADGPIIDGVLSQTPKADEVLTLMRDGVLSKVSVGFQPLESQRDGNVVVRTKVALRELSVVPFPAYSGAEIQQVREEVATATPEKDNMETTELDVRSIQDEVAELRRAVEAQATAPAITVVPDTFRSAGELLKAAVSGDETALRTYTGNTTADSVLLPGWVGDLTRIIDEAAILRGVFSTGSLPAEGNVIEYAQLKSNTVDIDVQAAEGDDLAFGGIEIEAKTAPVKTLGGYSTLSRQVIERSSVNFLDHTLRAQASQVGRALNTQMRTAYTTAHAAQIVDGNVVLIPASPNYADWLSAITDAAVKFQLLGLPISALVVGVDDFKAIAALQGADGRPVLLVDGPGVNNVGSINPSGLVGSLAGIPVVVDPLLNTDPAFVNSQAIRMYGSSVVRLQHDNVINLSRDFSVYSYVATATEIPAAIVPVVVD